MNINRTASFHQLLTNHLLLISALFLTISTETPNRIVEVNALSLLPTKHKIVKTALVTGSTDGIGLTTAKHLSKKGYDVILHGRDSSRIDRAVRIVESFREEHSNNDGDGDVRKGRILSVEADLSTIAGQYDLIEQVRSHLRDEVKLDLLVNNAGVFEETHKFTRDDLEMTFAANVLAPFVITSNLLPQLLRRSGSSRDTNNTPSRIVIASSMSQCGSIDRWDDLQFERRTYSAHRAYSESKLLDAMLSAEMASLLNDGLGTGRITCNCLDPGTVNTKMLLAGWGPCGIDVEDALDETWLGTSDEVKDITGTYFCWRTPTRNVYEESERAKLWSILESIDPPSADIWKNLAEFR